MWYMSNGSCRCGAKRIDMQIGGEPSPDCGTQGKAQCGGCFVCSLVGVLREVYRVLRDEGTCWLNLGDSYSSGGRGGGAYGSKQQTNAGSLLGSKHTIGIPDGNLVGIPWRVALALQADGWVLRQDIIWYSPNKMPEPVQNRCTKSHEHIFLLAKGSDYYYDAVAIAEEAKSSWKSSDFVPNSDKDAASAGDTAATGASRNNRSDEVRGTHRRSREGDPYAKQEMPGRIWGRTETVNKRDVWVVPTQGYPGAHFATFSPRLITPCILAGTSEHGCCASCGRPWERVVARVGGEKAAPDEGGRDRSFDWSRNGATGSLDGVFATKETVGWRKTCGCQTEEVAPCVVLDPFVGSGTTVATSLQLGRAGVGIDLSEAYLREHAVPRIEAALAGAARPLKKTVAMPPDVPPAPKRLRG